MVKRCEVLRWYDPDYRSLDRIGAEFRKQVHEFPRLFCGSCDHDPFSEQRARVKPPEVSPQAGNGTHDQHRRVLLVWLPDGLGDVAQRPLDRLLVRQGAVVHQHRRLLGRSPMGQQRVHNARQLVAASVADDGTSKRPDVIPVYIRQRIRLPLVTPDEHQRVTSLRIRDRHTGVTRDPDGSWNAGYDFERDSLFVEKQSFLAAAVEHERIPPLEPGNRLALAGLLRQKEANGVLLELAWCGGAHVDLFSPCFDRPKQAVVHEVVVDDDVRGGQIAEAAYANERGVAWARPDQVHAGALHHLESGILPHLGATRVVQDLARTVGQKALSHSLAQGLRVGHRPAVFVLQPPAAIERGHENLERERLARRLGNRPDWDLTVAAERRDQCPFCPNRGHRSRVGDRFNRGASSSGVSPDLHRDRALAWGRHACAERQRRRETMSEAESA